MASRSKTKKEKNEEIKIEFKYVLLTFVAALMGYIADFFRFPNSWTFALTLGFLILLIVNFNKRNGISILIYFMIWNALVLPLFIFSMKVALVSQILFLVINLVAYYLIISGLRRLKKWGFYLTIIVFALSLVNIIFALISSQTTFVFNLPNMLVLAKNIILLVFLITSVAYVIKSKKSFH